jgi:hypothetical protein
MFWQSANAAFGQTVRYPIKRPLDQNQTISEKGNYRNGAESLSFFGARCGMTKAEQIREAAGRFATINLHTETIRMLKRHHFAFIPFAASLISFQPTRFSRPLRDSGRPGRVLPVTLPIE